MYCWFDAERGEREAGGPYGKCKSGEKACIMICKEADCSHPIASRRRASASHASRRSGFLGLVEHGHLLLVFAGFALTHAAAGKKEATCVAKAHLQAVLFADALRLAADKSSVSRLLSFFSSFLFLFFFPLFSSSPPRAFQCTFLRMNESGIWSGVRQVCKIESGWCS